ncbi:transcriptional regulator [Cryptotrichosporon argae]
MNRQGAPPRAPSSSSYRPTNGMYYATAGQQSTVPSGTRQAAAGAAGGPGLGALPGSSIGVLGNAPGLQQAQGVGFPQMGGAGLRGPPGFARGSDSNDFPALGSHSHLQSSYATSAQASSPASSQQQLQQQMFMQGGAGLGNGLVPPPPGLGPGAGATPPAPTQQAQQGPGTSPSQGNGLELRGEDFPALGEGKDGRLPNLLKPQPTSPVSTMNGPSGSTAATPSTIPGGVASSVAGSGGAGGVDPASWARHSPSHPADVVHRPIQQILSSPVDKWGLKALLHQIKVAEGDRAKLLFGDELNALGMDIASEDPLYPTFVTPWADPAQLHNAQIEEPFQIPFCYHVNSQPIDTKVPVVAEDTLFYMFYSAPQDVLQLKAAEELFRRGWRYHTELQVWMQSPAISSVDLGSDRDVLAQPAVRGPVIIFNPAAWARTKSNDEFVCELAALEHTRPANVLVHELQAQAQHQHQHQQQQHQHHQQQGAKDPKANGIVGAMAGLSVHAGGR